MNNKQLSFVSFEHTKDGFRLFLPLDDFVFDEQDYEVQFKKAVIIYEKSIKKMKMILNEIDDIRQKHKTLPAQKVWDLGNKIFELQNNLSDISLQIDGLYHHLVRDLNVKRKWLEKVIIFRRYIPDRKAIPKSMNWGKCEKGTRRVAEELYRKFNLDKNG
ncbi:MAG: hypothetical protein XD85_0083 [Parcubacteria bacterium 34_609]|nr:MAG: hypothetical protein XD85_0083 [Parcubacteria bacterium 34_609]KUK99330.1 MAG: hypothetical protein XE08_0092 [Parcubacteria bacterium 32_520]